MRFVLPWSPEVPFGSETPTSRLLATLMPWMRLRQPAWLILLELFLHDTLDGRKILPPTRTLGLTRDPVGRPKALLRSRRKTPYLKTHGQPPWKRQLAYKAGGLFFMCYLTSKLRRIIRKLLDVGCQLGRHED